MDLRNSEAIATERVKDASLTLENDQLKRRLVSLRKQVEEMKKFEQENRNLKRENKNLKEKYLALAAELEERNADTDHQLSALSEMQRLLHDNQNILEAQRMRRK